MTSFFTDPKWRIVRRQLIMLGWGFGGVLWFAAGSWYVYEYWQVRQALNVVADAVDVVVHYPERKDRRLAPGEVAELKAALSLDYARPSLGSKSTTVADFEVTTHTGETILVAYFDDDLCYAHSVHFWPKDPAKLMEISRRRGIR